jgi:hypothetical protein
MTIWPAIAAATLVFGQTQNFGNSPDPEETKRSKKLVSQKQTAITQNWLLIGIAIIALIIILDALFRAY